MNFAMIKDLRIYEGLSQREVAKIIKCHPNTYGKYERGVWEIPLGKALLLAQYYDVSLDYLFGISSKNKGFAINKNELTKRMRYLRKKKGITQKEIANKLFCRVETYQRYELGYEETPVGVLLALAKLYGTTTDELVGMGKLL